MELIIRNTTNQPIYEQIFDQIKAQILSGALRPGDALPSIRALAKDLKISVITTKRAYDELESAGLIDTVAGKGCFVAEKTWNWSGNSSAWNWSSTCGRHWSWQSPAASPPRNLHPCFLHWLRRNEP